MKKILVKDLILWPTPKARQVLEIQQEKKDKAKLMVGARGFEPPASASRTLRAKPNCATPRKVIL
jgi:hypothetical protein